jgi:predicted component of type VI protein secretion system
MILSSTTLAAGAGSTVVAALSGAVTATLALLGIRHGRQVFAWMKKNRDTDDNAKDLDDADSYLKETFEKPCRAADLAPLRRLRNLIKASADQLEVIRTELHDVTDHFEDYLATGLPQLTSPARVPQTELDTHMERAMKQEHARVELERAVSRAQQRIRFLRKA